MVLQAVNRARFARERSNSAPKQDLVATAGPTPETVPVLLAGPGTAPPTDRDGGGRREATDGGFDCGGIRKGPTVVPICALGKRGGVPLGTRSKMEAIWGSNLRGGRGAETGASGVLRGVTRMGRKLGGGEMRGWARQKFGG